MTRDEEHLLREKYAGEATSDFARDCARLKQGEPLSYVIGTQPFLGLSIYLDSHPLIPRVETEWWTEWILQGLVSGTDPGARSSTAISAQEGGGAEICEGEVKRDSSQEESTRPFRKPIRILDLCAGSGAIGCAFLKYLPNARVSFGEIDPSHEATIKKNIEANGLDASRARIEVGDLFAPFAGEPFDLVVANPPYIPDGRVLQASVADFEPALALRAGAQGLDVIERIARELRVHLAPGGRAYIECDREHAEEARALFERAGLSATLRTDQFQAPRVIVVRFPQ